ncbi:uncharacterized protein UTRI_00062_B [Ustilago trichophora]|uniref:Uncharacterized protein n=1 Tax=Ustilago trichophora TaxID=86804 RepID=A0A5C3DQJ6_9BASI|nr:uncharacterized protein UTRI_00062_B [Ustilago trichophora]
MTKPIPYRAPTLTLVASLAAIGTWYFARDIPEFNNLFGGPSALRSLTSVLVKIHLAEGVAMLLYSLYRGTDLITAAKWGVTNFIAGFPTYFKFRKVNG